jgi:hypothetical protein
MPEPLIRKPAPAEAIAYVAERLREQPDGTALFAYSLTLDMLAEDMAAESDPPRTEWANRMERGGQIVVLPVGQPAEGGGERLARHRMRYDWYTALLARTVTYGPWVEMLVESEASDA